MLKMVVLMEHTKYVAYLYIIKTQEITSKGYARGINPILTSFLSTLVGITKFLSSKTSE
jgi:hypothetical protein